MIDVRIDMYQIKGRHPTNLQMKLKLITNVLTIHFQYNVKITLNYNV